MLNLLTEAPPACVMAYPVVPIGDRQVLCVCNELQEPEKVITLLNAVPVQPDAGSDDVVL